MQIIFLTYINYNFWTEVRGELRGRVSRKGGKREREGQWGGGAERKGKLEGRGAGGLVGS